MHDGAGVTRHSAIEPTAIGRGAIDLVAFDDGNVDELAKYLRAAALHHQQPRRDDFNDEAEGWQVIGGAPHHQFLTL